MALIRLPAENTTLTEFEGVRSFLAAHGIDYEKWTPERPVGADATSEAILGAYGREIETLKARGGYRTADVIDVRPDTPNLDAMLAKFSREHWHDEDEVRFIIEGRGLFHIHPPNRARVRHRSRGRRPHSGAAWHAPLVRSLRRSPHPGHPSLPGRHGMDAALHGHRRRPALPAGLLRSVVRVVIGRPCERTPARPLAPRRFFSTSKARRRRLRSSSTCCFRMRGSICGGISRSTRPRPRMLLFLINCERSTRLISAQASPFQHGSTRRQPRGSTRPPAMPSG